MINIRKAGAVGLGDERTFNKFGRVERIFAVKIIIEVYLRRAGNCIKRKRKAGYKKDTELHI